MNKPLITVLMSIHNGEQYVRDSVSSVLCQTYENFEFIIVDDGSTDGSVNVLRTFNDKRIRLYTNSTNQGLAFSLNRGLDLARGQYLARLDVDDICCKDRLKKQVSYLQDHPEVLMVGSWYTNIDVDGNRLDSCKLPVHDLAIRWALIFYSPFAHSAVMWRIGSCQKVTESLKISKSGCTVANINYQLCYRYGEDYKRWWELKDYGTYHNIPEYLVKIRTCPDQMTATNGRLVIDEPLKIAREGLRKDFQLTGITLQRLNLIREFWRLDKLPGNTLTRHEYTQTVNEIRTIMGAFGDYYQLSTSVMAKFKHDVEHHMALSVCLHIKKSDKSFLEKITTVIVVCVNNGLTYQAMKFLAGRMSKFRKDQFTT